MDNLTVIIPFWQGHDTINRLLTSLPLNMDVIIVDDHSDEPVELELDVNWVEIIRPPEKGFFAGACNAGINACDTDVLILNQDVWFEDDAWMTLITENRDEYGTIGHGVLNHPGWPRGYVQGTFMFIRRDAWDASGPFDADLYPLWGATCEWQMRACRAGFKALPLADIDGMGHEKREKFRFGSAIEKALVRWPERKKEFIRTPPEISVIIPCFNYGHHLADAVNSLIGGATCLGKWEPQMFQSFEIIIVDDASTDGSDEIVREMHDPWRGIKSLLLDKNQGTPGAINAGINQAYGRYITVLSADDMCESWSLERMHRHIVVDPKRVIYGDIQSFKNGARLKVIKLPEYDFDKMLIRNSMHAGILYAKQAWKDAGGYPPSMIYGREDWAFNIALGEKGYCGYKMPGTSGYLYRRERHNRSLRTQGSAWRERFLAQLMSLFPGLYNGERPMGCCGGRRRRSVPQNTRQMSMAAAMAGKALPGKDGFRLIQYSGLNVGSQSWWGPVSGTRYTFGNNDKDRIGYVDVSDYEPMLDLFRKGRHLFAPYTPPEPELGLDESEVQRVNPNGKDDFTQLKGVGPAIAAYLAEAGFVTVAEIANSTPSELSEKVFRLSFSKALSMIEAAKEHA